MPPIIWENCRRNNGSLDLRMAYTMTGCRLSDPASRYLDMVEKIMPIKSRQVAAMAIATAMHIDAQFTTRREGST